MTHRWVSLDNASPDALSDQLAAAIRRKIALGELKPGDRLPSVREMARICGTSVRVPLTALDVLTGEGAVVSRPRLGTIVLGQKRKMWRGRVLVLRNCVCPDYTGMVLREEIAVALARASWRVEFVSVPHAKGRKTPDMNAVTRDLAEDIDFAICCFGSEKAIRALEEKGVKYAVLDGSLSRGPNNVVNVIWAYDSAVREFAADCVRKGVERVFAVSFDVMSVQRMGMSRAMADAGIALDAVSVTPSLLSSRLESFRECGYRAVRERLADDTRPEVVFFADDYLAVGGMWALAEAGLRVPEDVKVVTVANRNNVPFFPKALTRMEWDQSANGARISRAILKFLRDGVERGNMFLSPGYFCGETF